MNIATRLLALGSMASLAAGARADIVTHTGNTGDAPAYKRLLEDLSALSMVGTAVRCDTYSFSVSTTGTYSVMSTAKYDNFVFLFPGRHVGHLQLPEHGGVRQFLVPLLAPAECAGQRPERQ